MRATARDRVTAAILVLLGGVEALDSDYMVAITLAVLAVADCVVRHVAGRHQVEAVARAVELPAGIRPTSDPVLLAALERAGVPAHRVAAAIEARACDDCVRLPIRE